MSLEDAIASTTPEALARSGARKEPEKEITPSELWLALTAIPRPSRLVPFPRCIPGTDKPIGHVRIWPLTQEEQHEANAAADRFAKDLLKDPQRKDEANLGYHHAYTNDLAVQVLHRACRDESDLARPAFMTTKKMRANFSTDEIGVLFSTYCTVQSELGPIRARMSAQETEALIIRLAEGGSAYPLDSLSWELQRSLAVSMASRLVSCWMAMSSHGLPPDVSTFALDMIRDLAAAKALVARQDLESDDAPEVDPLDAPTEAQDAPDAPDAEPTRVGSDEVTEPNEG